MHRLLSLLLLGGAACSLGAQSPDATVDRAVAAWSAVRSAHATFEQTVTNAITGSSATARGEFDQLRPNRLSIRFTEPEGDRIVADGKSVWIYLPSSAPGQVIRRAATGDDAVPIDITGQFLDEPKRRYQITDAGRETVAGHPTHVLSLVPRPGVRAAFTHAKVWVDDDNAFIRQFEVVEPSGVTRKVRLTSFTPNASVDRALFSFSIPKGAKVVDEGR